MNTIFLEHLYKEKFKVENHLLALKKEVPFMTRIEVLNELNDRIVLLDTIIRNYMETHRSWRPENGWSTTNSEVK
jgi:hypothetical protein